MLKRKSETVIPVSCTEQGRWSYVSAKFAESGVVMSPRMRGSKSLAVATSLEQTQRFGANQSLVWAEIQEMSDAAGVTSSTQAMREVFDSKSNDLEGYLAALPCLPNQKGLLAIINGEVAGFDFLSRESAYTRAHPKLARSYALDALLQSAEKSPECPSDAAKAFLEEACQCKEKRYKSIGHGWDHRFEGDNLVGSALTFRNAVIHMAFFRSDKRQREERLAQYRQRRDSRASLEQRVIPNEALFLGPEEAVVQQTLGEEPDLTLEDIEGTEAATDRQT